MKKLVAIGVIVVLAGSAFMLWPDEITQTVQEIVTDKRFTSDGWEIVDSCLSEEWGHLKMQGWAMHYGIPTGIDRMDNPCDSIHAYYFVVKR